MRSSAPPDCTSAPRLTPALTALIAVACGVCVANLYYAQPLLEPIARSLALPADLAGLVTSLTQLGYGLGLLLLVPLADAMENRRLVLATMAGAVIGLVAAALAPSATAFLGAAFMVGTCAVAAQVLVPLASQLAPEATRGRVVGNVMAGLLAGVMLARPFSSLVAAAFGWRAVFGISALGMVLLMAVIARALPARRPLHAAGYAATLATLPGLVRRTPLLRRRAAYQGLMFAGFQVFWTAVPLVLAHDFGLGQRGIAAFALAGAAGALSAPAAGRLADRGHTRAATGGTMAAALLAWGLAGVAAASGSMGGLVIAAVVVDAAVQMCQVLSLRNLYLLAPELRGRFNALFMTFVFLCAAIASATAAAVYAWHGWTAVCALGGMLALAALLLQATEWTRGRTAAVPRPPS